MDVFLINLFPFSLHRRLCGIIKFIITVFIIYYANKTKNKARAG